MPFTEEYVNELLKKLANKPGNAIYKAAHERRTISGREYDEKTIIKIRNDFANRILRAVRENVSSSFPASAIMVTRPQETPLSKGGRTFLRINFYFNSDVVWRDSLWHETPDGKKYNSPLWAKHENVAKNPWSGKYGVNDIVYLFAKGWNARGRIYVGPNKATRQKYAPSRNFIVDVFEKFNRDMIANGFYDVRASYAGKYTSFKF